MFACFQKINVISLQRRTYPLKRGCLVTPTCIALLNLAILSRSFVIAPKRSLYPQTIHKWILKNCSNTSKISIEVTVSHHTVHITIATLDLVSYIECLVDGSHAKFFLATTAPQL